MIRKTALLLCALLILSLFSCTEAASVINGLLGIDDHDYAAEKAVAALEISSQTVSDLAATARILTCGSRIVPFDTFSDASDEYIDTVLNYLASENYVKYSSDRELLESFSAEYPDLNLSALIPLSDYENAVYRCFGGNRKAVVKSTALYTYLDRISAFMLAGQSAAGAGEVRVMSAEETENTYRISAYFIKDGRDTQTYDIIFRKRDGGEPYIWRVTETDKIYSKA